MSSAYLYLISSSLLIICLSRKLSVSVTNMDKFNRTDYSQLIDIGATQIVFAQNWLYDDGSVIVPQNWFDADLASDISAIAAGHNATTLVGVSVLPFVNSRNASLEAFKMHAQSFLAHHHLDGILFEVWEYPFPVGTQWKTINDLVTATKTLKTRKGSPARAAIMFSASNFTTSSDMWHDLRVFEPWKHSDENFVVFDASDVDFEAQISPEWAEQVVTRFTGYSMKPDSLSLGVIPEALSHTKPPEIYRHLADQGAPTYGDGHFKGYYYNTQKQVKEKLSLESKYGLRGLSFIFPSYDLPPHNTSSLLFAAA